MNGREKREREGGDRDGMLSEEIGADVQRAYSGRWRASMRHQMMEGEGRGGMGRDGVEYLRALRETNVWRRSVDGSFRCTVNSQM